jgi:phosphatidylglycerol:prolipoprotein diacylglycerol transferase
MLPYLHLGWFNLPTFGLMLWFAAVAAAFVVDRGFRREKITADAVGMVAIALVAGIVGAKLWHVLDTPEEFRTEGWRVLWDTAGFAWYGGMLFGIMALVVQGLYAKIGALRTLDLCAPAAAIGYGIGRIGCFLSGDGCYGIVIQPVHLFGITFHPWGMAFPHGIEPIGVPVYPTPLYELGAGLLIGCYLWWRGGKPHAVGAILGQYLALAGLARFLVEFIRRNPKVLWGLSNAQLASAGAVVVGVALTAWAASRPAFATSKAPAPVEKPA